MLNRQTHCLLVVHDDDVRAGLAEPLRGLGYNVRTVSTASEALGAAAANRCDLLITELDLSDSDGESLMHDLRRKYGMDGIAIGGFVSNERLDAATRTGFRRFLLMPLRVAELVEAIQEIMATRVRQHQKLAV